MARKVQHRGSGGVMYRCVHRLWRRIEKRAYDPGALIKLTEKEAAPLLDAGAIEKMAGGDVGIGTATPGESLDIEEVTDGENGLDGSGDQQERADSKLHSSDS